MGESAASRSLIVEDVSGELDLFEVRVAEDALAAGKSLDRVSLPRGSLVVSAADGKGVAGSDTRLERGRIYLVAAESTVADEITRLFGG